MPSLSTNSQSELVFYIRHQKGFTKTLHKYALDHPDASVAVMIDGPYGGVEYPRIQATGSQLIIAGGSGAGWCLPFVEHFFRCQWMQGDWELDLPTKEANSTTQSSITRRGITLTSLKVILATRDTSSRVWFEEAIEKMMQRYGAKCQRSSVQVQVYLTGEAAEAADASNSTEVFSSGISTSRSKSLTHETISAEAGVAAGLSGEEQRGRPRLASIIQEEAERATAARESLAVYVCGPLTMQNDVRNAVAAENLKIVGGSKSGSVYLHTEHFGWA